MEGIAAKAIGQLRATAVAFEKSAMYRQMVEPRDQILARLPDFLHRSRTRDQR
jgi:hypothetical protein